MANPLLSADDIVSIYFDSRLDEQQILLTTHWRVTDDSATPCDLFQFYTSMLDALEELGGFTSDLMACYSEDVVSTRVMIQKIHTVRYIHETRTLVAGEGLVASPAAPPQVSHAIVLRATETGPTNRGTKKIGGCPTSFTENGYLTDPGRTALESLTTRLTGLMNCDVDGSPVYIEPIIYHRPSPSLSPSVWAGEVLPTTRSQRRRTVGYGS